MFAALVLSLTLAAPRTDEPVKLALPGFTFVRVDSDLAGFFSEHFAQKLTFERVKVTTAADISTLLGFERQKELLGCSENAQSCIAELANALGVDGLVVGSIGKFGDNFQLNIKTLSSTDGRLLCAYSTNVKGEQEVLGALDKAATSFAAQLKKQLHRTDAKTQKGGVLADGVTLTTPGLKLLGIDKKLGAFLEEHLVQQFVFNKTSLATPKDIATLLGQERQRELIGCVDSSKCQVDLATLMKADGVLSGQVAKLEGKFQVNLKVVGATSANTLAVFAGSARTVEELLPVLNKAAGKLAGELKVKVADERGLRAMATERSGNKGAPAQAGSSAPGLGNAPLPAPLPAPTPAPAPAPASASASASASTSLSASVAPSPPVSPSASAATSASAPQRAPAGTPLATAPAAPVAIPASAAQAPVDRSAANSSRAGSTSSPRAADAPYLAQPESPQLRAETPSPAVLEQAPTVRTRVRRKSSRWPWGPTIAGSVLLLGGTGCAVGGMAMDEGLDNTPKDALTWGGLGGIGAGALLIAIAGIVYAASDDAPEAEPLPTPPPMVSAPSQDSAAATPPPAQSEEGFLTLDGGR